MFRPPPPRGQDRDEIMQFVVDLVGPGNRLADLRAQELPVSLPELVKSLLISLVPIPSSRPIFS